ncbi:hypothetical protein [Phenylobacterium aquaticum]|uniref:hypothetical protein n=1 Tax=Phenylobacterium aquaticum TaxID=1763816 RepID=UPI0026F0FCD6|nr:hypothetical protein [Phenylobacterium aquaticum]
MDRRRLLSLALFAALAPAAAWAGKPKDGSEGDKKSGGTSYIAIATLTATVVKPGGRRGVMTVDCGLDIPDKALHDKTQLLLPRLRAAYIQTVQIYAAGMPQGPPPSIDYLSRELQRQTDLTLGAAGAKLLLGSVLLN